MSNPDLGQLMAKAKEMQDRLAEVQRELAARSVEASSGGGMVRAQVTSSMKLPSMWPPVITSHQSAPWPTGKFTYASNASSRSASSR